MEKLTISFVVNDDMTEDDYGFQDRDALVSFFERALVYTYDNTSTIKDMLEYICKTAPIDPNEEYGDQGLRHRFHLKTETELKSFYLLNTPLKNMLAYIGHPSQIELDVTIGYPGGGVGVGDINGIHFHINSNESNHMGRAHVHAEYAGRSASIDILTGELICGSLPSKKLKIAISAVKANKGFLIHAWKEYTNGFAIPQEGYYYDKLQKKMFPIPYG